jgi:hypothetical protein
MRGRGRDRKVSPAHSLAGPEVWEGSCVVVVKESHPIVKDR